MLVYRVWMMIELIPTVLFVIAIVMAADATANLIVMYLRKWWEKDRGAGEGK